MPFVSYAQNSEDVMLWRAFRDVARGFYVDVGAAHPDEDSVTRAFYDRGWHGINIEAVPAQASRVAAARPRDITLAVAAGASDGTAELQVVDGTGLSTTDGATAAMLHAAGFAAQSITVPMRRLAAILDQYAPEDIHFLKIDVEGAERAVIEGCDFRAHRPRVILVEATKPMSTEQTHETWEGLLLQAAYRFAFFDGLNRFYVAEAWFAVLGPLLATPVNVLDDYIRVSDAPWARRAAVQEATAANATARAASADANARAAYARAFDHAQQAGELRVRLDASERGHAEALAQRRAADAWGEACNARTALAEANASETATRAAAIEASLSARLSDTERRLTDAQHWLAAVYRSTSWRLTRPLRAAMSMLQPDTPGLAMPAPTPTPTPAPTLAPPAPPVALPPPVPSNSAPPPHAPAEVTEAITHAPAFAIAAPYRSCLTVNQFHSGSATGDAITNGMLLIRRQLRKLGYRSDIFVSHRDPGLADELKLFDDLPGHADQVLLVHHSLGQDALDRILAHPAQKVLIYHNITPPEWLPESSNLRAYAALGRQQLQALRGAVVAALADSEYNAIELRRCGFDRVRSATLLFDLDALPSKTGHRIPDAAAPYTVLFVGRVIESKAQADLVDAFARFRAGLGRPARLVLVGRTDSPGTYLTEIKHRIDTHGLATDVVLTGPVDDAELAAQYAAADLYVSLSHHEGFGVPLIEAMASRIPVLAWPGGAVPYTLGDPAGILHDRTPDAVAARMLDVALSPDFRTQLVAGQTAGLQRFTLARQWPAMQQALALAGAASPPDPDVAPVLARNLAVTITGHTHGSYSLAAVNRAVAGAIDAERPGQVRLLPIEGLSDAALAALPPDARRLAERGPVTTGPEMVVSQHYPVHVPPHRGDLTTALLFWEESLLPAATIQTLQAGFDAVLAPTRFVAKALTDSGLPLPVRVIGQAPDLTAFEAIAAQRAARASAAPFTFLHVSSCFPRKGADVLLAAYASAFRSTDPVRLVIKGFPNPHNTVPGDVAALRAQDPGLPEIEVIDRDLDQAALLDLYCTADAMVLPTRGEGFNLPAAEAMAAGIPLIVTGLGGHMDFCDAAVARLLTYRLTPSDSHLQSSHSLWAEPDLDDLVAALRELAAARHDPAAAAELAARTARARAQIGQRLGRRRFVQRLTDTAVALLQRPPPPLARVAWITSWDVRCGVAEYARHLIDALPPAAGIACHVILADDRTADQPSGAPRVRGCWRAGDPASLPHLASAITSEDPDIIVVQHQPGLMPWPGLARMLALVGGRTVVVTLHNTVGLAELDAAPRQIVLDALGTAARIAVHTLDDMHRLLALGLAANVTLMPHGVQADRAHTPHPSSGAPLIGCYGFFLPGKGIGELIHALAVLRQTRPDARLRLVNAEYGAEVSTTEIARCRALATAAGLDGAIDWETRFLPDAESRARLAECDVVVIPTQSSKEASSAAVRTALATGRPVIVTPLPLFDDVGDAVFRSEGPSPDQLASSLDAMLSDAALRDAVQQRARTWLDANVWPIVSTRFQGMLLGLAASPGSATADLS